MLDFFVDKYLSWKTGKDRSTREWEKWYHETVVFRASTIENMFMNFKHVIIVDADRFMDSDSLYTWTPNADARQYFWPARDTTTCAVWRIERVRRDRWDDRWHKDEIAGEDKVFVATNNDEDAMMIGLKFT